eukprot:TRINITY_DN9748_c0_g1_i1.p1 TRINITY_DN9748_c0_g1~~TRINITY_DN9748_c0_g1_i1.p1  ORF type:complete len:381 (-),score=84.67 TRINITY_DN9748_c0_g1_i1:438-1517(-)
MSLQAWLLRTLARQADLTYEHLVQAFCASGVLRVAGACSMYADAYVFVGRLMNEISSVYTQQCELLSQLASARETLRAATLHHWRLDGPTVISSADTYLARLNDMSPNLLLQGRNDCWGLAIRTWLLLEALARLMGGMNEVTRCLVDSQACAFDMMLSTPPAQAVAYTLGQLPAEHTQTDDNVAGAVYCAITIQLVSATNSTVRFPVDPYLQRPYDAACGAVRTVSDASPLLKTFGVPYRAAVRQALSMHSMPPTAGSGEDAAAQYLLALCGGAHCTDPRLHDNKQRLLAANSACVQMMVDVASGWDARVEKPLRILQDEVLQRLPSQIVQRPPAYATATADLQKAQDALKYWIANTQQ